MRYFGFNFPPKGWALCNGQTLAITQNTALFSLLGTFYGGNGINTFQLPNLQGRVAIHQGQGPGLSSYSIGQTGGEENHTLTLGELPAHTHNVACTSTINNSATETVPQSNYWARENNGDAPYTTSGTGLQAMHPSAVGNSGGGQPHSNIQPALVVSCCIALQGIFPSRS
jgi:microcystin-dependent protein